MRITLRPTLPPYLILKAAKIFSETLSKIHVFITQTGNNHPEIGRKHAGKMIVSSFVSTSVSTLLKIDYE